MNIRQYPNSAPDLAHAAGSPARQNKRDAILCAALELFVIQGFAGTSMDDIALKARVARQTIYNHFSGKQEVFRALAGSLTDRVTGPLPDEGWPAGLREVLVDLARRMRVLFLQPSSLALHRLLICEAPQFPELGREVYLAGPRRAALQLAEYLRRELPGTLSQEDALRAAEQFFGMVLGQSHLRALLGVDEPEASTKNMAEKSVDAFLRSWGAR